MVEACSWVLEDDEAGSWALEDDEAGSETLPDTGHCSGNHRYRGIH